MSAHDAGVVVAARSTLTMARFAVQAVRATISPHTPCVAATTRLRCLQRILASSQRSTTEKRRLVILRQERGCYAQRRERGGVAAAYASASARNAARAILYWSAMFANIHADVWPRTLTSRRSNHVACRQQQIPISAAARLLDTRPAAL